jgi:hypothetical protein
MNGREQAGMGATIGDYNHAAVRHFQNEFLGRHFHSLPNNGDGTFDDVTSAAGLGPTRNISVGERCSRLR